MHDHDGVLESGGIIIYIRTSCMHCLSQVFFQAAHVASVLGVMCTSDKIKDDAQSNQQYFLCASEHHRHRKYPLYVADNLFAERVLLRS